MGPFRVFVCLVFVFLLVEETHSSSYISPYQRGDYREFYFQISEHFKISAKEGKHQFAVIMILDRNHRYHYYGSTRSGWLYYPISYLYHYTHDTDHSSTTRVYCYHTSDGSCLYPDPKSTTTFSAPAHNRIGNYFVVNTGTATDTGFTTAMVDALLSDTIMEKMHQDWQRIDNPDIMLYSQYIPNSEEVVFQLQRRLKAFSWQWVSPRVCVYFTFHGQYIKYASDLSTQDKRIIERLESPEDGHKIQTGVVTTSDYYYDFYTKIHAEFKTSRKPHHTQFSVFLLMDPVNRNAWIRYPKNYMYAWRTSERNQKLYGTERIITTVNTDRATVGNYVVYNLKSTSQRNLGGERDPADGNWQHSEHSIMRHYLTYLKSEFALEYNTDWIPEVLIYTWIFPCKYCSQEIIETFRHTTGVFASAAVSVAYTTIGKSDEYFPDVQIDVWRPKMNMADIKTFYVIRNIVDDNLNRPKPKQVGVCKINGRSRREAFDNCDTAQTCMMECLRVNTECFRLCCCCDEDSTIAMVAYSINSLYAQCHSQSASIEEKRTCWRNWLDRNIGMDCACASKSIITEEYTSCLEAVTEELYAIGPPLNEKGTSQEDLLVDILRYQFIPSQCLDMGKHGFMCTLDKDQESMYETSTVRLVNGNAYYEGRLEARNPNGDWLLVCDDYFDLKDATVACRQLNFEVAQEALTRSHFGSGSGKYILDDLGCKGTESSIFSCPSSGLGRTNCREGEAASVRCALYAGLDNDDDDDDGDGDTDDDVEEFEPGVGDAFATYGETGGQDTGTPQETFDCSAFRSTSIDYVDGDDNNDDDNNDVESGVYEIGPSSSRFQAYCDMDTDGGGWTVIQRREDDDVDFYKNWVEYEEGFGDLDANFWLGLKKIYLLTNTKAYRLRIDMTDFNGKSAHAIYESFRVESASHECPYCLRLGDFVGGDAGDSMGESDPLTFDGNSNVDQPFSTKDRLNAGYSYSSCVGTRKAGWWFSKGGLCGNTNPNGKYFGGHARSTYYPNDVIYWYTLKNDRSPLKTIEMKIYPVTGIFTGRATGDYTNYG